MGLEQLNWWGKEPDEILGSIGLNKVETAIAILQAWEPPDGYYGAFGGGKDSVGIHKIAELAKVKVDWHYCVSPIDPPQVHKFIREYYPDVQWDYHARGFWQTVDKRQLPMRQSRWCCEIIKEAGGIGRVVIVGNRRYEGTIRKHQKCYEQHRTLDKTFIRPIIEFTNSDIWQFIREYDLPYCSLYDEGVKRKGYGKGYFKRLGCVLCPFSRQVELETLYFPKIAALWRRACDHIIAARLSRGNLTKRGKPYKRNFKTGQELYDWWISRD